MHISSHLLESISSSTSTKPPTSSSPYQIYQKHRKTFTIYRKSPHVTHSKHITNRSFFFLFTLQKALTNELRIVETKCGIKSTMLEAESLSRHHSNMEKASITPE